MHVELNVNENDQTKPTKLSIDQFGQAGSSFLFSMYISSGSF